MSEPGPSARRRLSREAATFLTNYVTAINAYPQWPEKQSILATIRSIPGNEWYTIGRLNSWLARSARRQSSTSAVVDEESILFPKLSPTHLQQLRMLYRKRTDPAENIITFWAERIKADRPEVAAWIQYQQEKAKGHECRHATPDSPEIPLQQLVSDPDGSESPTMPTFPRAHLPTPAKSTSPSESPHERMLSLPPIAVKLEEIRQCMSPVTPISALDHLPPLRRVPSTTSFRAGARLSRDLRRSLTATIRESLSDSAATDPPPKTPDEFATKFLTFEKMMDAFMEKHASGQLARLGWDPNISSAGS